jgi:putative membrane protein
MMVFLVAASVAALAHVGFFVLESLLWTRPAGRRIFGTTEAEAETIKFMAYNQGFYNLFLAIGAASGVGLVLSGRAEMGRPVVVFACACMLGAAAILATGGKRYLRGVIMQGLPPLVALAALLAC